MGRSVTLRRLSIVLIATPLLIAARALRVRLSVGPRFAYWNRQTDRVAGVDAFRIVALGDSLTQGIGSSSPQSSWLGAFLAHLGQAGLPDIHIENRSIYGAKVADLIASQLPLPDRCELVILCIGANDSGRTEPEVFRSQMREVCGQLPAGSIVGDVPTFQWGPRIGAAATLSQVVRDVVAEFPALVPADVERHTADLAILTDLSGDFFHPGDRGYARVTAAVIEAFDRRERATGRSAAAW